LLEREQGGKLAKVIAVFADGTGNSSAKLFRTNVWRLYQALDTSNLTGADRQVSYYHDGVGTSSFRPLALLGGAFGWGLKRNVLDLYSYLCRVYEPGDRLYLFGFSRGAFTVRVLAGLVLQEGLVADTGDKELQMYVRDAYRHFRCRFNPTGGLVRPLRNIRDRVIEWWRRANKCLTYTQRRSARDLKNRETCIEFIGVFDTVAAYGTPFVELTRAIDYWIWPLSLPDYQLSNRVRRARHALALDDERDTFHPLLWDERNEQDANRLKQVWFAGVHSDVGGGYPDDALAFVSLDWMRKELPELRFKQASIDEILRLKNACGPLHDSRRGIGGYYRYQPRKLSAHIDPVDPTTLLMQNPSSRGRAMLRSVNIHQSVFDRICHGADRYAPIVLPATYQVVDGGNVGCAICNEIAASNRAATQEEVWDWVWHKRVNYFLTVFVSLALAALPLWQRYSPPTACIGVHCLISPAIESVGAFAPGFVQPWTAAFARTPGVFTIFISALLLLLQRSSKLKAIIEDSMRTMWDRSLELPHAPTPVASPGPWVRSLRTARWYQRMFQIMKWGLLPNLFGFLLLLTGAALVLAALTVGALRTGIWFAETSDALCEGSQNPQFTTASPCWSTGMTVTAGMRYRVHLTVLANAAWRDLQVDTSPKGFDASRMPMAGNLAIPLRRSISARWFQPIVKIKPKSGMVSLLPLEFERADTIDPQYTTQFTAPKSGNLYLFVNDVLLPQWAPHATYFYDNNQGAAKISIEPILQ